MFSTLQILNFNLPLYLFLSLSRSLSLCLRHIAFFLTISSLLSSLSLPFSLSLSLCLSLSSLSLCSMTMYNLFLAPPSLSRLTCFPVPMAHLPLSVSQLSVTVPSVCLSRGLSYFSRITKSSLIFLSRKCTYIFGMARLFKILMNGYTNIFFVKLIIHIKYHLLFIKSLFMSLM